MVQLSCVSGGVNMFCKKSSVFSQLKCVTDRRTDRQTDRRKCDLNSRSFTA